MPANDNILNRLSNFNHLDFKYKDGDKLTYEMSVKNSNISICLEDDEIFTGHILTQYDSIILSLCDLVLGSNLIIKFLRTDLYSDKIDFYFLDSENPLVGTEFIFGKGVMTI